MYENRIVQRGDLGLVLDSLIMFNPHVDIKRSSSARSPFVLF